MDHINDIKICSGCKIVLPFTLFSKNRGTRDGLKNICKSCAAVAKRRYKQKDPDRFKKLANEQAARYRKKHPETVRKINTEYGKVYRELNRESERQRKRKHYEDNKPQYSAKSAKYRASRLGATPSWLSDEQLREIQHKYLICRDISELTGITYHVDHIHPLQGKDICGLHVPWNIQILTAEDNLIKGNKHSL